MGLLNPLKNLQLRLRGRYCGPELELLRDSLENTGLSCEALGANALQVHIFGLAWPPSTSPGEHPPTAECPRRTERYPCKLPVAYGAMDEDQRSTWRCGTPEPARPLLDRAKPPSWTRPTARDLRVFRMLERFANRELRRGEICRSYVISMCHTVLRNLLEG